MGKWSTQYVTRTAEAELRPIYAMIVCEDWTYARPSDSYLEDAVGVAETSIQLPSDQVFDLANGDTVLVYDKDGFEFLTAFAWNSGTQQISTATRGQFGTIAKNFDRGAVVAKPLAYFATQAIQGTTLPFSVGMEYPTGGGQSVDMRENRTTVDDITVVVQDENADIPRYFKRRPIIGLRAIILGGYEGMDLEHYSFLGVGSITNLDIRQTNIYEFTIESILSQMKANLFGDVEDYSSTLVGSHSAGTGVLNVVSTDGAYINGGAQTMATIGSGWLLPGQLLKCGLVCKVDGEYILTAGGIAGQFTVAIDGRGYWNTTAAAHSGGAAVDYFFGFEGHPIAFLLGLLLTKQTDTDNLAYQKVEDPGYYWDYRAVVDQDRDKIALGIDFGDIEIDTFHDIRQKWFVDYIFRYKLAKRLDMENFIPKNLLKPLGLALYVNRAGKLALMIMKPPLNATPELLNKDDIIGVPTIAYTNHDMATRVLVRYDYDGDFANELRLIDAESEVAYDRNDEIDIECIGLDSNWRGEAIAERIARRKLRPIKAPNPILAVNALFSRSGIDIGQIVELDHPDLPDVLRGTVGWDKLVMVIGKSVDWQTGALTLEVIDTQYFGKRYGLIAPSGTADYSAASDVLKATYCFISDDVTEKMGNGDPGYLVM